MSKLHGNRIEVGQMNTSTRNSLSNVNGHLIYNTTTNGLEFYNPAGWQSLGSTSPDVKSDYPTPTGTTTVFTSTWPGSPSNLPVNDSNSTYTAPSTTTKARVIVIGSGAGHPSSYPGRGHGGVVDALITIEGGAKYKCIVASRGNTGYTTSDRSGRGASGCGGSPGVDSNDTGTGGAGSAFFYAPSSANSDNGMFPKGVLIAGGGGGGGGPGGGLPNNGGHAASHPQTVPDPIGGFSGLSRSSALGNGSIGEGGLAGGKGGRLWASNEPGDGLRPGSGPNPRGTGGNGQYPEGYGGSFTGGGGGGAGAGGGGHSGNGENAPNGRGYGYGSYNDSGAGYGGSYPMRGGNGFSFNGVNLGGGGGGGHGSCSGGGGWGGGGNAYYDRTGGAGGSGAWGYIGNQVSISELPQSGPPSIPINGGNVGASTPCPTTAGLETNDGAIIIMT